jgi:hypothetical protein
MPSKGTGKISQAIKTEIASDIIAGFSVQAIAERHDISPVAVYRLRSQDSVYKQIERELLDAALSLAKLRVVALMGRAIGALGQTIDIDPVRGDYIEEGMDGEQVKARPEYIPKLVEQRRLAANDIIGHAMALADVHSSRERDREESIRQAVEEEVSKLLGGNKEEISQSFTAEFWQKALQLDPFEVEVSPDEMEA